MIEGKGPSYALFVDPDRPDDVPPSIKLDRMERIRKALMDSMRGHRTLDGALDSVAKDLKLESEWRTAAQMTLESFLGSNDFVKNLPKCATRLAGNHDSILEGMALSRWTGDIPTWAVLHVATAVAAEGHRTEIRLNSVWGPSAGMDFTYRMGHGAVANMMIAMGLHKTRLPHRLWLTNMWAMAVVDAGPKGLRLDRIGATSALAKRNNELMSKRENCDKTLKGITCETCPEGLDTCRLAVRPRKLVLVKCKGCGVEKAMEPGDVKCHKCRRSK